jgi:hypothetical protein
MVAGANWSILKTVDLVGRVLTVGTVMCLAKSHGGPVVDRVQDGMLHAMHGDVLDWRARLLFPTGREVSAHVEEYHSRLDPPHRMHPDNLDPAVRFLNGLGISFQEASDIDPVGTNVLAMGEPSSDFIARWIFPHAAAPYQNPLRLPVTYAYFHDATKALRTVEGREYSSSLRGVNHPHRFADPRPVQLDREGYQIEDFLVISALPNFTSESSIDDGSRIVIAGGVHGLGTRAFPMVFSDDRVWRALEPLLDDHRSSYFQAVFHVPSVSHDGVTSEPTAIDFDPELDFYSLDDQVDEVKAALKDVLKHRAAEGPGPI